MARLLAVVGVSPEKRVRCRAEGCNRPVYARIHVVEQDDGTIKVLGSSCYAQLYGGKLPTESIYTGGGSRQLTEAERQQLEHNTEQLIAAFERERITRQEQLRQQEQERAQQATWDIRFSSVVTEPPTQEPALPQSREGLDSGDVPESQQAGARTVKCQFCGGRMLTLLPRAPAIGYKCKSCKEAGVTESLYVRKRKSRGRGF